MSGLYYCDLRPMTIVGTKSGTTRTSWALTTSYQTEGATKPTKQFPTGGYSKATLEVLYTMGAAETSNTIEIKVEESPDGTNFYQLVNESASSGTSSLFVREFTITGVNASTQAFSLPLDCSYKWMRVSFKESGVAANAGSVYCEVTLAGL